MYNVSIKSVKDICMNITKYYRSFRKKKIVIQYFAVLIMILIVPILLSFFVINAANEVTKEQIEENTYQTLIQLQTALDRDLTNIRDSVYSVARNSKLNLYSYERDDPQSLYDLSELVKLSGFKSMVRDIVLTEFIYIKADNIIISEDGKFTSREFFDHYRFADTDYSEWLAALGREYNGVFADIGYASPGDTEKHIIEYRMSYPIASQNKGTIVVMLDYDKMRSIYGAPYSTGNKTFFLTDNGGNVILSFGGSYSYDSRYNDIAEGYAVDPQDKSTMLFKVKSGTMSLNYLSVIELSAIKEQGRESRKVITVYTLIVIVLCGICAAVVARKASLPVVNIYKMIHKDSDMSFDGLTNEVKRIIDDKKRIEDIVSRQEEVLREQYLFRLIMGQAGTEFDDGKYFIHKRFMVLMIETDTEHSDSESQMVVKYAVKNIAEEIFGKESSVYGIDIDRNRVIYVFNFNIISKDNLHRACAQLIEVIEHEFSVEVSIGIGGIYDDASKLSISFGEAEQAAEYSKLSDEGTVEYADISNLDTKYYYGIESENAIVRHLINGDKEAAMQTVNEVIEMHKGASPATLKCLFFHIIATLLSLVNNKNFNIGAAARGQMNIDSLFRCESVPELKRMISEIFDVLIGCVPDSKAGKRENFREMLLNYTEQNFTDNNMSLDMIATQFNVHPTYISHFFKEYIGENFSDYIAKKRIEKAKELLAKDYTLNDVAAMVGYANSAVLIKKFKKVVGVTPGEYRRDISK